MSHRIRSLLNFMLIALLLFGGLQSTTHQVQAAQFSSPGTQRPAFAAGAPDDAADVVYGQGGVFTTGTANKGGVSANSLSNNTGLALDGSGNLYLVDTGNNRALFFLKGSTTATRVYGQSGNFTTSIGAISADRLYIPTSSMAVDSAGNLYISDTMNNRVLYYPKDSTTATRVYGQDSFTVGKSNKDTLTPDATTLSYPGPLVLDANGNLYVSDGANNRILFFPKDTTTATRVYGQGGVFTTKDAPNPPNAGSLMWPSGLALDSSGNLYAADYANHRVLYYPKDTTTATRVYGQGGDFTANTANNGGISANSLYEPKGLALDSSGNLYVGDTKNNRILYYPAGSTTATGVYGQNGLLNIASLNGGGTGSLTPRSLNNPSDVKLDSSGNLYVNDGGNNRVLVYKVPKSDPVISFTSAPTPTYGDVNFTVSATSTNTDDAALTYSKVSGPCTQSGSTATFLVTGAGDCVVRASGAETANFNAATQDQTVTIAKAQPVISFTNASIVNLGGGNFTAIATTTNSDSSSLTFSKVSGACTFVSGAVFTPTGVGACVIQAEGSVSANFLTATQQMTVTISNVVITFDAAPSPTYLGGDFTVSASSSNTDPGGDALTYSVTSGPCTLVSGATFSSSGAGDCVVKASGAATANFSAWSASQTVTIAKAQPVVTFAAAPTPTYLGSDFTVSATTTNGDSAALTYSYVNGPCTQVSGGTFSATSPGDCVIKASGVATSNFLAASSNQTVTIAKAVTTITFDPAPTAAYLGGSFVVAAVADSGAAVTYSYVSGPCTQSSAGTFNPSGAGDCVVNASAAATTTYAAANLNLTVTIDKANNTIAFAPAPTPTYLGGSFTVAATGDSPAVVSYTKVSGPCTQSSGATFNSTGAGDCVIQATSLETSNYFSGSQNQTVTIAKAQPVISFTSATTVMLANGNFTATATTTNSGSSSLTFSKVSGPCTFTGGAAFTPTGKGVCIIQAEGAATANFTGVSQQQSVTINDTVFCYFPLIANEPAAARNVSLGYEDQAGLIKK